MTSGKNGSGDEGKSAQPDDSKGGGANDHGGGGGGPPPSSVDLIFFVNGKPVTVSANAHQPLGAARAKALADSKNTGRPPEEWEIRTEGGENLDPDRKVGEYGLADGTKLYLNLKVGAGG